TSGSFYTIASANSAIDDGLWHLFAGVRQGTTISLYIDGVLRGTATSAAPIVLANNGPVRFGQVVGCPASTNFVGQLDEVRYYGRALNAGELGRLTGPTCGNGVVEAGEQCDGE